MAECGNSIDDHLCQRHSVGDRGPDKLIRCPPARCSNTHKKGIHNQLPCLRNILPPYVPSEVVHLIERFVFIGPLTCSQLPGEKQGHQLVRLPARDMAVALSMLHRQLNNIVAKLVTRPGVTSAIDRCPCVVCATHIGGIRYHITTSRWAIGPQIFVIVRWTIPPKCPFQSKLLPLERHINQQHTLKSIKAAIRTSLISAWCLYPEYSTIINLSVVATL